VIENDIKKMKGFIAEQPGNVTVYSAVAREFNTKAEQPGITAGR